DPKARGTDRFDGRADLRFLQFALSKPDRNCLGRLAGPGCSGLDLEPREPGDPAPLLPSEIGRFTMQSSAPQNVAAVNGNGHVNGQDTVIDINLKSLYYSEFKAVRDTRLTIKKNTITAFIGPSGCGKSTVLRSLYRMNDLVRGFRFDGHVNFRGKDIYDKAVDPVAVRRYIGMVFQ